MNDKNVERVIAKIKRGSNNRIINNIAIKFKKRSELGIKKYGTTTCQNDLTPKQWLIHAQEELMDALVYLEAYCSEVEKLSRKHKDRGGSIIFCIQLAIIKLYFYLIAPTIKQLERNIIYDRNER